MDAMNGFENRKACNFGQKHSPGCMGRMVNLFDFSTAIPTSIPTSRLLMEKEHQDGAPLPRSLPDLADKVLDPIGDQIREDNSISQESSSYKKSNRAPMKMLMAREMSKEMESNQNPPSVVARLMGLDALPAQQPVSRAQTSFPEAYSQTISRANPRYQMPCEIHPAQAYAQQSSTKYSKCQSVQKDGFVENPDEKKTALVRQKFIEKKRLATDEKLRQSKEFQEALEVLNTNKDLFLKFLQEPNSLFLNHCYGLHSIPPTPHTKRIMILKPSKTLEEIKKPEVVETNALDKNKSSWSRGFSHQMADISTHPTRIVVLKPSPGMTSSTTFREMKNKDYYGDSGPDGIKGSREIAKEITQLMRESICGNRREENLLSSVLSNKYVGDESSFTKEGNLSDSEVMTPTTGIDSPFSSSSLSRASYPRESSVIREAKKRLSERWAIMKSNGSGQEQQQIRRSTSTLGEMLSVGSGGGRFTVLSSRSFGGRQDLGEPDDFLTNSGNKDDGGGEDSPRNLLRSRSITVSSKVGMNIKVLDPDVGESVVVPEEGTKSKHGKSSIKGKVSSLFFSRNTKLNKDKAGLSSSVGYRDREVAKLAMGKKSDDSSQYVTDDRDNGGRFLNSIGSPISILVGRKNGAFSAEALLPVAKSRLPKIKTEVQDQPSAVSDLELDFEDVANDTARKPSGNANSHGRRKSSPPSWVETASSIPVVSLEVESQEQELFMFVKKILSTAALGQETSDSVFRLWHCRESLLDPLLCDKVVDQKLDKHQRLLYDCVSAALADVIRSGMEANPWMMKSCGRTHKMEPAMLIEEVWSRVREWFSCDTKWFSSQSDKSFVVERVVREEVVGRGGMEMMGLEVDGIAKEIEGAVMEQLLEEALAELTCVL